MELYDSLNVLCHFNIQKCFLFILLRLKDLRLKYYDKEKY